MITPLPYSNMSAGPGTLSDEIARIISDRGSFRNIQEENLQGTTVPSNASSPSPSNDQPALHEKVLQLIANAQNEASLALEMTSLLLSACRTSAETAMSPVLRERIPTGSLGAARIRGIEPKSDNTVPKAWKDQVILNSSTILRQASDSSNLAIESEAAVWTELIHLLENKWTISRGRSGNLGVLLDPKICIFTPIK
ncbi:Mediator of RNA polymerase II transcription subunit 17 [Neolecta irregularis DAH-3]|uniref:Mediator of RNA polymerase II transcription subunit 17 n=1 Tax=Neolecta irregularis (strain DAH-3) TaxID=1198029 RepID=A0A1U7LV91_NEOID|nr:Mediator of RNA polymerase II transcription subunit 17 [Neolecta irregularis DAH-3]|eukprot:OLL26577.1 Mediator of RNA polymerase II transcription subunit 17 [Neolecta irregularis DAH-3]